jgi:ABC-type nickel/cobalt efflux system permease component RcnA
VSALFAASLLALLLGLRHALEPDHLAAVSTMVADRAQDRRASVGFAWGAGHGLALLVIAGTVTLFKSKLPASTELFLESCVAAMLMVLGARSIARARGPQAGNPLHHRHGGLAHAHAVAPQGGAHLHVGRSTLTLRPLVVGAIHGMAGSGALVVLAAAAVPGALERLVYVVMFAVGSWVGMGALAALASRGLDRVRSFERLSRVLYALTGASSMALGVLTAWPMLRHLGWL